jgi:hypothetical protein
MTRVDDHVTQHAGTQDARHDSHEDAGVAIHQDAPPAAALTAA